MTGRTWSRYLLVDTRTGALVNGEALFPWSSVRHDPTAEGRAWAVVVEPSTPPSKAPKPRRAAKSRPKPRPEALDVEEPAESVSEAPSGA